MPKNGGRGRPTLLPQTERELAKIFQSKGEGKASLENLADHVGRSRSLVRVALKNLIDKSIVKVEPTRPKTYSFIPGVDIEAFYGREELELPQEKTITISSDTMIIISPQRWLSGVRRQKLLVVEPDSKLTLKIKTK